MQLCWKMSQLQPSSTELGQLGNGTEGNRVFRILNDANHRVALSQCWVVRSSCHSHSMDFIITRCVLFFDIDGFQQ